MDLIVWNEKIVLGVSEIDKDHKLLVDRVNEIISHSSEKQLDYVANEAVADLVYATRRHFSNEEEMMEDADYPDREIHMAVHRKLMVDLKDKADILSLETNHDSMKTVEFFKNWLIDHIMNQDTELASFIKDSEGQETIDLDP